MVRFPPLRRPPVHRFKHSLKFQPFLGQRIFLGHRDSRKYFASHEPVLFQQAQRIRQGLLLDGADRALGLERRRPKQRHVVTRHFTMAVGGMDMVAKYRPQDPCVLDPSLPGCSDGGGGEQGGSSGSCT